MSQSPVAHPLFADLQTVFDLASEAHAPRGRHDAVLQAAQRVASFLGDKLNPKPAAPTDEKAPIPGPGSVPADDAE